MKSKLLVTGGLVLGLLLLYSAGDVFAYPWFARRLVDNCNKCHVAFPKTNDYGWYVKATGYELPEIDYTGLEESPVKRFLRYLPAAVRFKVDAINSQPSDMEGDLNIRTAQLISGGSLFSNRISWWFHKHLIENNEFENLFQGLPHEMWGQYNLHLGANDATRVSVRYGMSELPLRFSPSKTKISEMGYAVYGAMLGQNGFMLSTPQYGVGLKGVRLGGDSFNEVKTTFDLAFVNGRGNFSSSRFDQVFGRVGTAIGNTAVGAFTYLGSTDVPMAMDEHGEEPVPEEHGGPHAEELMSTANTFFRAGFDLDMNVTPMFNIYALGLYGRDSNPMGLQSADAGYYYGGFLGLDYCPGERLMLSWRFDAVRFGGLPAAGADTHDGGGMDMDHGGGAAAFNAGDEGHPHGATGHLHGEMVTTDTDAMVFGVQWLPWPRYYGIRLTAEYRIGFRGLSDKLLTGVQFAL